ncbi:RDD family protein [Phycicoccus sp. BSK3Z-2]|uniref:RDD family protein n=1 Tax=Phycicoccus avicenniae TaxID=2828860 RepID=A0A941HXK4_9MICO|nr:RDD family protein [Phycicoccus avicenniae]MBR7741938.1 RDD family protein [Phycicoccus avicenniae]
MTDQPYPPPQHPSGGPAAPGPAPAGPPTNPYGGHAVVPAPGYPSAAPGTIGYVETHFGRVATFEKRFLAYLVDTLLVLVPLLGVFAGFAMMMAGSVAGAVSASDPGSGAGVVAVLASGAFGVILLSYAAMFAILLWNRVFRMGSTGQSVGKSWQGIVLIDAVTGVPIGPGRCFLRELVSGLVNQVVYLSSLWMLWDPDRQTVHDKVVTSAVIEVRR